MVGAKLVNNLTDPTPYHLKTVINIKDLASDPSVVDGVSLMRALVGNSQFYEMKQSQQRSKQLYNKSRVTYE